MCSGCVVVSTLLRVLCTVFTQLEQTAQELYCSTPMASKKQLPPLRLPPWHRHCPLRIPTAKHAYSKALLHEARHPKDTMR